MSRLYAVRNRAQDEKGFTLIELLVVILIIGILAAIAIPSFLNQKDKANDASAQSAVRTAQTAMETYQTDNSAGDYSGADAADLVAIESTLADVDGADEGALTATPTASGEGYLVSVQSQPTDTVFTITRDDAGTVTRTCNQPGTGSCRSDSTWGKGAAAPAPAE